MEEELIQEIKEWEEYYKEFKKIKVDFSKEIIPEIHQSIQLLNQKAFQSVSKEKMIAFFETIETLQNNLNTLITHEIVLDYKKSKV